MGRKEKGWDQSFFNFSIHTKEGGISKGTRNYFRDGTARTGAGATAVDATGALAPLRSFCYTYLGGTSSPTDPQEKKTSEM